MGSRRKFERFCNRSMPLMAAQYWYRGERYGLGKIINNVDYYNPLFVYKKNKGTDVYYEIDDNENDESLLTTYFRNNPNHFKLLAKEYRQECDILLRLINEAKPKDFSKIFNLHTSFWPKLSIMVSIGGLSKKGDSKKIVRHAYNLRKETEKIEYLSGNNLLALANQLLPNLNDFIYFLTFEEIKNRNIPSKKELLKRKQGYIYFEDKIYTNITLGEFKKTGKIEFVREETEKFLKKKNMHILNGVTAMKGKVRGRVRIIFEEHQLSRIKDGDILVTPMTTPDYIFAMKKALAFITDEGGITCHAAITAREMKKPCIIGTKIATQILKDNDLVEVDAYSGVVKILKKR